MAWHGMAWHGMAWHGMASYHASCCDGMYCDAALRYRGPNHLFPLGVLVFLAQMAPAHITCVVLDARQHRIIVGDEQGTISCYYFETGVMQKAWAGDKAAAVTAMVYGGEVRRTALAP
jgi:hypothetical protein